MKELIDAINRDGELRPGGVVLVSNFLNHRMRTGLIDNIGAEFYRIFKDTKPTLVLTIEASGIAMAMMTARYFGVDVLFAKKSATSNIHDDVYTSTVKSFTHGTVSQIRIDKKFISSTDRVLIIDDFLAVGEALNGLIDLCHQAGAEVVGAGICVEKSFQPGGKKIRESGINLHSLAVVDLNEDGSMSVREDN